MKALPRRAIPLVLVASMAALLLPATATAQAADPRDRVTMVSDEGDWVGAGLSYDFDTDQGDLVSEFLTGGRTVQVSVRGINDQGFEDQFDLFFDALATSRWSKGPTPAPPGTPSTWPPPACRCSATDAAATR